ncbi:MAG: hypothetical protein IKM51_02550, partial [Oscillospiraceae bacterium]|nr:hypothetical protein [Oscillospiraceae bacterium]
RQGVTFSDGTLFNASNVEYSYNLAKKNAYYKNNLKNIESFTAVDNFTLKITFNGVMLSPLNALSFPIVLKTGNVFLGTGKYVIKYLEDTPYLEVNKNHSSFSPEWNNQIALFDMAGSTSEVYAFKSNKISVYKDDLTDGKYENLSSKTVSIPTNNLVYAGLNMRWGGSITSVAWIRRVINIGINRIDISAASFLGQCEPTTMPFKPGFYKLSGQELISTKGDLNRAITILENNGYDKFTDEGYRTDGVNTLRLSILVCNNNPYKKSVAEALQKSLATLGIKATISVKNKADYLEALKEGFYEIYIGEIELPADYDLNEFFTAEPAEQIAKKDVDNGSHNKAKAVLNRKQAPFQSQRLRHSSQVQPLIAAAKAQNHKIIRKQSATMIHLYSNFLLPEPIPSPPLY